MIILLYTLYGYTLLFVLNDVFSSKSNIPALVELLVVTNYIYVVISEEP